MHLYVCAVRPGMTIAMIPLRLVPLVHHGHGALWVVQRVSSFRRHFSRCAVTRRASGGLMTRSRSRLPTQGTLVSARAGLRRIAMEGVTPQVWQCWRAAASVNMLMPLQANRLTHAQAAFLTELPCETTTTTCRSAVALSAYRDEWRAIVHGRHMQDHSCRLGGSNGSVSRRH
jgi:hypothetical protein